MACQEEADREDTTFFGPALSGAFSLVARNDRSPKGMLSAGGFAGFKTEKSAPYRLLRNTGLGGKQMRKCPRGSEGIFHGFHSGRRSESGDVVSGDAG